MEIDKIVPEAGNLAGFIEQFPVFASAPGGVDELRKLIIHIGMQGDLIEFKSGVENKRFSNVFSLEYGKNLPKKARSETGEYPVYGSNGVVGTHNKDLFQKSCLIVGRKGSAGALNICSSKGCWITDVAYYLIPPDYMDLRYSYYLLLSLNLDQLGKGIKPGLNRNEVYALGISYPPKEEQKRIVAKVDELMALCDKLEAQQQKQAHNVLQANTSAIHALLNPETPQTEKTQKTSATVSGSEAQTQFEQNWQRIAQHFNTLYGCTLPMPDGEGRKKKHLIGLENVKALRKAVLYLGATGKLVNPSNFKDNNQQYRDILLHEKEQKINDGLVKKEKKNNVIIKETELEKVSLWEYLTLSELFDFIDYRGKTPSKLSDGIPLITAKNIRVGYINREPAEAITFEDYQSWMTRGFPQTGDILFTTEAPLGNVAIVDIQEKFALAQRCINLQPYSEVNSTFFMYVMMSDFFQIQLLENATGVTAQGIKAAKLKKLLVPVPSLEEQKHIVAKVDQLMALCDQLEQQLTQSYSDAEKLMQATVKALVN